MSNILQKIFGKVEKNKSESQLIPTAEVLPEKQERQKIEVKEVSGTPTTCLVTCMELYRTIPEIRWAIDFIARRAAGARFVVKRTKDDSVVWNGRKVCDMLIQPNCIMGWREFVFTHFVYKLATGNAFQRAAMGDTGSTLPKHKYCSNFWPLPADKTRVYPTSREIPMYGIAKVEEIIDHYAVFDELGGDAIDIPAWQVWHDRDGMIDCVKNGPGYLKSTSRLLSLVKPISNLIAVYEARNVIYVKRGGIGFLVSLKQDDTGSVAMTSEEKKDLRDQLNNDYGVTSGKSPIGITDVPLSFVRTNLSISELQPFDETLEDAIKIAGAYGIPSVLVPRKDQATFANQSTAEKAVYCGVIIPMVKQFCEDLSQWLGLNDSNIYIDCDFSDVDCLQVGMKEAEQVKTLVNVRCCNQFMQGLITLNDWRAQIHESQLDEEDMPIFSKLRWQMSDEEIEQTNKIILNLLNNNQPSTGEEDNGQRNEEKPGLRDQGE